MPQTPRCRFYTTNPDFERGEIIYAVRYEGDVGDAFWAELIGNLPGEPGKVHRDLESAWELTEELDEDTARIDVMVWEGWAIIYQNVGYPLGSDEEHLVVFREVFEQMLAEHPAMREIISLFGTTLELEPDAWTRASLDIGQPSTVPTLGDREWPSPYLQL